MIKVMRTKPANPLWKRLQRQWRVQRGFEAAKTHRVDWVWADGVRYKRIRFEHPEQASQAALALQALNSTNCFPALVRHEGSEVWVTYIKKDFWVSRFNDHVADFFATLYNDQLSRPINMVPATVVLASLVRHLRALSERGLIDENTAQQVDQYAHQVAPPVVAQGFDYVDAIKKNFVVSKGRAIGIDIEALLAEQYLGMGLAKAEYRGLIHTDQWLEKHTSDDRFIAQYPLVRVLFLVSYFDQKQAQGKLGHIRVSALLDLI